MNAAQGELTADNTSNYSESGQVWCCCCPMKRISVANANDFMAQGRLSGESAIFGFKGRLKEMRGTCLSTSWCGHVHRGFCDPGRGIPKKEGDSCMRPQEAAHELVPLAAGRLKSHAQELPKEVKIKLLKRWPKSKLKKLLETELSHQTSSNTGPALLGQQDASNRSCCCCSAVSVTGHSLDKLIQKAQDLGADAIAGFKGMLQTQVGTCPKDPHQWCGQVHGGSCNHEEEGPACVFPEDAVVKAIPRVLQSMYYMSYNELVEAIPQAMVVKMLKSLPKTSSIIQDVEAAMNEAQGKWQIFRTLFGR